MRTEVAYAVLSDEALRSADKIEATNRSDWSDYTTVWDAARLTQYMGSPYSIRVLSVLVDGPVQRHAVWERAHRVKGPSPIEMAVHSGA